MAKWKRIQEVYRHESNFYTLREERVFLEVEGDAKEERQEGIYTLLDAPDFAAAVPLTPEGKVVMIRNHRYPLSEPLIEIPAGIVEEGEDPLDTAIREMEEEVGYSAERENVELLCWFYPTANLNDQKGWVYLARDVFPAECRPDPGEVLEIFQMPLDEALEMLHRGEIRHPATAYGLMMAERGV